MYSLNRATIIGNMTRDPEMRYTASGQAVTSFGVATNRSWTGQDGTKQESVEFHNCVAWGKLAEITSQILKKGQPVYVEGRLQTRSWDAPDGSKHQRTEIVADNFVSLTRAPGAGGAEGAPAVSTYRPNASASDAASAPPPAEAKKEDVAIEDLDDIPF